MNNPLLALDDGTPSLAGICRLQAFMQTLPQLGMPLQHHFAPNAYARQLFMEAGSSLVGKMHATHHLLLVACGEVTLVTDGTRETVRGPTMLHTTPGTKRAIHAHTDATLVSFHVTDLTDPDEIVAAITVPDPLDLVEGDTA